jgi:quinol monooxygenase YgiN
LEDVIDREGIKKRHSKSGGNPMLIFYGVLRAKKEKISLLEKGMIPFLEEVAKEEGVLEFKFLRHKDDPTWFLAYEVYQDQEAFERHRKSQHVDKFVEDLMESVAEEGIRGFWEEIASIQR